MRVALVSLALLALSACTINGSRQLNEECLQSRECVAGLACLPSSSTGENRLRCAPTVDGGVVRPDVAAAPDVAEDVAAEAAIEASVEDAEAPSDAAVEASNDAASE